MTAGPRLGIVAVARPTFDLEHARAHVDAALGRLRAEGAEVVGDGELALDADSAAAAARGVGPVDRLVVLQATFADASAVAAVADAVPAPLTVWSFPEEWTGGRLRANSLCGANLAAFELGLRDRPLTIVHADPTGPPADLLDRLVAPTPKRPALAEPASPDGFAATDLDTARRALAALAGTRVGRLGDPPDGFAPCRADGPTLRSTMGIELDHRPLPELFAAGHDAEPGAVAVAVRRAADELDGLERVPADEVERSMRLYRGLRDLADARGWTAVGTRCWPECFTEFGAAACRAQAMLADDGVPTACEADVHGALTSRLLQELSGEPPFLTDLVDADAATDRVAVWHCGVAPTAWAAAPARATLHSNRGVGVLGAFALRPGPVTVARLSGGRGTLRLVLGAGELLDEPAPFDGTSGVLRLEGSVDDLVRTVAAEGLDHHVVLARGDHLPALRAVAALAGLPVVELPAG